LFLRKEFFSGAASKRLIFRAAKGLFYPPDPVSRKFSTMGGNVAENAGGMRAVKYGVTSNEQSRLLYK